ncbi:PREDICTED: probable inactive receptor-like protein kinase At3g56050 [Tarenaya hassleriana]|uniref:probable inactive receptor-like protein kinase At3g56050 n=1 Tax=Tarenaya hassleriana TaxID=28532 RepID=UPI00053C58BE|nr:PREDICTED: probable inactive receptor-like protein kinase At3g56050 [Tarenaya hassleriana]
MDENWKSVRLRLRMCFSMAIFVLFSFGSCSSLNDEGLDLLKCKAMAVKGSFSSSSAWKNLDGGIDLCSDRLATDSSAVGFHRKLLSHRFFNPYAALSGNRSAAIVTPPASSSPPPSPTPMAMESVPMSKDVSAPPPSVPRMKETPQTNSSSTRSAPSSSDNNTIPIVVGCIGAAVFLILLATGVFFFRSKAGKSVNPWRTGLSGQLQKAFVTGVPKLKRSELEAACEDFSNVIGSCPIGTLFKGTLSSGVEIAVASVTAMYSKDWKDNVEMEFRKKIETLSKTNHKNFVNLLGYCEEDNPFTRMMVFEYAPNGSVFEHLHFRESEHLDWGMRLRIAMGIAYCLDYIHRLNPPVAHSYLLSSTVQLMEDYAVKVADLSFGNQQCPSAKENSSSALIDTQVSVPTPEDNVYSFGVLLFEIMTGKLPDSVNKDDSVDSGISDFSRGETLSKMADPRLESFDGKIEEIGEVIKSCIKTDPRERPTMRDVVARLREITGISPEDAAPKLSPLWWAELEVMSTA